MEILILVAIVALVSWLAISALTSRSNPPPIRRVQRHPAPARPRPYAQPAPTGTLKGKCWVIDGDTIVIEKTHIRLAGIDAPELNHPWGRKSKLAMINMCKGKVIRAELQPDSSYDRVVAICYLPDGRDLAAELVKMGLAIDWPKFSGGRYRQFEPPGIRKKLWRADAKQKGRYDAKRHG